MPIHFDFEDMSKKGRFCKFLDPIIENHTSVDMMKVRAFFFFC